VPQEGEVLVRNIFLSLDPAERVWMSDIVMYLPPIAIGEVIRGITIGVVEPTRDPAFQEGDLVQGILGMQEYAVAHAASLTKLPKDPHIPLTLFLNVLGHIGISAYFGLLDIGKPQAGETLVVSGAAGAVGSIAGQIGKIKGCRVVGLAGSDEKCRWLTQTLGFDAAINYKTASTVDRLKAHCPDGIDIYFDNVGGSLLDAVLGLIALRGRVVCCGMISAYNVVKPVPGPSNALQLIQMRARMEGFLVFDYLDPVHVQQAMTDLGQWLAEGKIQFRDEVVDGLENAIPALNKLFDGSHTGKLLVKISPEPSF
jgi:NADPH-dependent curcumin reductase CurA